MVVLKGVPRYEVTCISRRLFLTVGDPTHTYGYLMTELQLRRGNDKMDESDTSFVCFLHLIAGNARYFTI